MRVLLVEDDPKISAFIKIGLESNDIPVDTAFDGAAGEQFALARKYDVIVLDIMMPVISGFELCRKIRNHNIHTPVMMLTSLNSVDDKLTGFSCGADDYLVKPFSFHELLARVKVLSKRTKDPEVSPVVKVFDLVLETETKKVYRNNKEIELSPTEFKLLELFMTNKNKLLTRIYIAEKVWGYSFNSGTSVIDIHVNSLKFKIENASGPVLIQTIRGLGYILTENILN